jgi:hypothetical protein
MTVNRYATQAGKRYETELMKYLREQRFDVERLRLSGAEDEGDLVVLHSGERYIIEAKRTKAMDLGGWVKEAQVERLNYAKHRDIKEAEQRFPSFVVVHYARGKGIGQSYVTTTLDEWLSRL